MHTKIMAVCIMYVALFSVFYGLMPGGTFPPEPLSYTLPSGLTSGLNLSYTEITFSWESVIAIIITLTVAVTIVVNLANVEIFGSGLNIDARFITKLVVGLGLGMAVISTMYFMIADLIPSWLHIFLVYAPGLLLIYSIIGDLLG